ncbi:hypothetical protein NPIL_478901 [Nephila pilipes]|uniref:Uncharacterized protein n=1 Tax=Nephila pilipes TaxID=299642 RepID=A0A8X6MJI4_NEPPI|nr:hypothetical protein NPIL_478901 [Nephila pilipes]
MDMSKSRGVRFLTIHCLEENVLQAHPYTFRIHLRGVPTFFAVGRHRSSANTPTSVLRLKEYLLKKDGTQDYLTYVTALSTVHRPYETSAVSDELHFSDS